LRGIEHHLDNAIHVAASRNVGADNPRQVCAQSTSALVSVEVFPLDGRGFYDVGRQRPERGFRLQLKPQICDLTLAEYFVIIPDMEIRS